MKGISLLCLFLCDNINAKTVEERIPSMNEPDSESRRRELLRQTRRLYGNDFSIPAVHPRYRAAYHSLYGKEEESTEPQSESSFFFRLVLSVILFLCFIYIEQNEPGSVPVSSSAIVSYIQSDGIYTELYDQIKDVW